MFFLISRFKFIIFTTLFLVAVGALSVQFLPISLYPMVNKPTVRVTIPTDQDVHTFYKEWGQKIESSLQSIENVTYVEGTYQQQRVRLFVHFNWDVLPDTAKRDVETIISFYQAQLPKYLPPARVDFYDPSSENYVTVTSDEYSNDELSQLLRSGLKPQLDAIEGVAASLVSQVNVPYVSIRLKPYKMAEYGITLEEVLDTLQYHEYDYKLGQFDSQEYGKIDVKFQQAFRSLQQLKDVKVQSVLGRAITIEDIAIIDHQTEKQERFFFLNEDAVVAIAIWPEPDANLYQVSERFQQVVNNFVDSYAEVIVLNNPKKFIEEAIVSIAYALVIGMFTAALIVTLFYRRLHTIVLIVISMPMALGIGLLVMKFMGVGLNLLSLGGMSISIGIVVDSAIVVIDRIERQRKQNGHINVKALLNSIENVAPPILASAMTSLVVFMPLAFTEPMISTILKDIALVTVAILLASVFLSLFFIPACYLAFFNLGQGKHSPEPLQAKPKVAKESLTFRLTLTTVEFFQRHGLIRNLILISVIVGCVYGSEFYSQRIKTEIVAKPKAEIIDIEVNFKDLGLTKEDKLALLAPMRKILGEQLGEEIKYIYSDVRTNLAYLSLHLTSYKRYEYVLNKLPDLIKSDEQVDVNFSGWVTSSLNVKDYASSTISFADESELVNRQLSQLTYLYAKERSDIVRRAKNQPGDRQANSLSVEPKYQTIEHLFSEQDYHDGIEKIQDYVSYATESRKLYDVRLDGELIPLKIGIEQTKNRVEQIEQVPLLAGEQVMFIQDLVRFRETKEWNNYYSQDSKLRFQVEIWFKDTTSQVQISEFYKELEQKLSEHINSNNLPMLYTDSQAEIKAGLKSIVFALVLSVVLVFLIILLQFNEIIKSLIVLSVILFGVFGALIALYSLNSTISINSLLGMLILVGLTVNNSILLLDQYSRELQSGLSQARSIVTSLFIRMKALVVTNLTTIAGMMPLVIGFGPGEDILKPLGISVALGLLVATLLTIIFVPLMMLSAKNVNHVEDSLAAENLATTEH